MPESIAYMKGWENFYVITGSAAAGLTGLTFVVIALASDANMVRLSGLRTFITPIVIHFGSVLWIASVLSIPGHTALSLSISLVVTATVLTIYSVMTLYRMHSNRGLYVPALQDWIWNAGFPLLCCLSFLVAGLAIFQRPVASMYIVGVATLAMLFIGVHNAWDLAVWITAERPGKQREHQQQDGSPPPAAPP